MNLEIIVEELSAERALRLLLPALVGPSVDYEVRTFRGKADLLKKLPARLAGYATYVRHSDTRIVVLVDRDDDDCLALKKRLVEMAERAGLISVEKSVSVPLVLNRIAVEELEAWFFGDFPALRAAYPRVPSSLGDRSAYRDPDEVSGGTWEALEHVLQKHGYHRGGLAKAAAATEIAVHMDVEHNRSHSFRVFRDGIRRLTGRTDA